MPVYVAARHADMLAAEGQSTQTVKCGPSADQGKMLQSSENVAP